MNHDDCRILALHTMLHEALSQQQHRSSGILTLQVRYGWTPTAALGPQMARLSERAKAATLRDCADRIDYEAAFGSEAWHSPESPGKVATSGSLPQPTCMPYV